MKRNLFTLITIVLLTVVINSCADSKEFTIGKAVSIDNNGNTVFEETTIYVEPYGWADYQELRNSNVIYKVNVGNIVWDIILSETIVIPIWLTGWQLCEPVKLRDCAPNCSE